MSKANGIIKYPLLNKHSRDSRCDTSCIKDRSCRKEICVVKPFITIRTELDREVEGNTSLALQKAINLVLFTIVEVTNQNAFGVAFN